MKWETEDPVIFKLYNTYYGNKYIDGYWCMPNHAFYTDCPILGFNYSCPMFKELQIKATKAMQPVQSKSQQCVVMLLTNLAEPQWVSIPCEEDLLPVGVCVVHNNNLTNNMHEASSVNVRNAKNRYFCLENYTMINYTCYAFIWDNIVNTNHYTHSKKKTISVTVLSLLEMHVVGTSGDPDIILLRQAFKVQCDLTLIYYWGGLRSAAPTGGGPCSAVL